MNMTRVALAAVVMNVGRRFSAYMAVAGMVEWIVVGVSIGLVYQPVARAGAA